jgi:hypothetical protein
MDISEVACKVSPPGGTAQFAGMFPVPSGSHAPEQRHLFTCALLSASLDF